ncbi:MAG: PIN domain-containing protein [Dermatophilaceae bacterium]
MNVVLDASAVLAFVSGEPGAEIVEAALESGATCGAANWSEVAQKVLASGRDWELVRALLVSYGIRLDPIVAEDAEWAARRWRRDEGLSLGVRLCLALGSRLGVPVLTADAGWGRSDSIRQIR